VLAARSARCDDLARAHRRVPATVGVDPDPDPNPNPSPSLALALALALALTLAPTLTLTLALALALTLTLALALALTLTRWVLLVRRKLRLSAKAPQQAARTGSIETGSSSSYVAPLAANDSAAAVQPGRAPALPPL